MDRKRGYKGKLQILSKDFFRSVLFSGFDIFRKLIRMIASLRSKIGKAWIQTFLERENIGDGRFVTYIVQQRIVCS